MFTFFKKLLSPFAKIKSALSQKIRALFSKAPDDSTFDHLEQLFYEADLGATTSATLVDQIRALYRKNPSIATDQILAFVKQELLRSLPPLSPAPLSTPHVFLLVGVNGSGKTTTLA